VVTGIAGAKLYQGSVVTGSKFFVNGNVKGTSRYEDTSTHTDNNYLFRDGEHNRYYFKGDVAEVLIFDRALTDAECQSVESYLMTKWLETTFPSDAVRWPDAAVASPVAVPTMSGLNFHLDAEQVILSDYDASKVYEWVDRAPAKRTIYQSELSQQPTYVSSATATGRPAVRFDGSNDRFNDRITLASTGNSQLTYFAVVNPVHKSGNNYLIYQYDNYQPNLYASSDDRWNWNKNRGDEHTGYGVQNGAALGWQVVTGLSGAKLYDNSAATGSKLFVNSIVVGVTHYTTSVVQNADYNYLFHRQGGDFFSGDVAEVLIFDRALSDAECQTIETYLYTKWFGTGFPTDAVRWPDAAAASPVAVPTMSGLNFHLDAEQVIRSGADLSRVYQMMDRTGESGTTGRMFFQAELSRQPTYVSSATATGRPAVRFDGSNDRFNDRITLASTGNSQLTYFAVVNPVHKSSNSYLIYQYDNYQPNLQMSPDADRWNWNNNRGDYWSGYGVQNGGSVGSWQVVTGISGAKLYANSAELGSKLFVNSNVVGTSRYTTSVVPTADNNYLFHRQGSDFFSGDVAEVLIFDRALSDAECQTIETYLYTKWFGTTFPTNVIRWPDVASDYDHLLTKDPSASPQPPVTSGLQLHLDAEQVQVTADGNNVYQWIDRTAHKRGTFWQGELARQPQYIRDATNGRPAVRFDGSNDRFQQRHNMVGGGSTVSMFAVMRPEHKTSDYNCFYRQHDDYQPSMYSDTNDIHHWNNNRGDYYGQGVVNGNSDGGWQVVTGLSGAKLNKNSGEVGSKFFVNGTLMGTSRYTTSVINYPEYNYFFYDGQHDRWYFSGDIAEILVFSRALSDAECQQIETYLYSKWFGTAFPTDVIRWPDDATEYDPHLTKDPSTSPQPPITDSIELHFDAEYVQKTQDGNNVYQWVDRSTHKRTFWQPVKTKQPLYVQNAAFGRPVVRFDGVDDFFSDRIRMTTSGNKQSFFAVLNPSAKSGDSTLFYQYDTYQPSLNADAAGTWYWNNNRGDYYGQGVVNGDAYSTAHDGWQVVTGLSGAKLNKNSAEVGSKLFVNSDLMGTSQYTTSVHPHTDNNYVFHRQGGSFFAGDVAEILVFSRELTDAECQTIETYLYSKWFGTGFPTDVHRWQDVDTEYDPHLTKDPSTSPQPPITDSIELHFDAEYVQKTQDGNNVYQWVDRSKHKRTFWQPDTTRQPLYVQNVANGRPVVRFDGSNDRFSDRINMAAGNDEELTFFAAVKPSHKSSGNNYLFYQYDNYQPSVSADTSDVWHWNDNRGDSYGRGVANGNSVSSSWQVLTGLSGAKLYQNSNLTGSKFFVNSMLVGSSAYKTTVSNTNANNYVFHRQDSDFFIGDVAEILVYKRVLSDAECQQVEAYLYGKWFDASYEFPSPVIRWGDLASEYDPFLDKNPTESPQPPITDGLNFHLDAEQVIKSTKDATKVYQWIDRTNSTSC
jgi:hypothetical protein